MAALRLEIRNTKRLLALGIESVRMHLFQRAVVIIFNLDQPLCSDFFISLNRSYNIVRVYFLIRVATRLEIYNIRRICCLFSTRIELDYIVLYRIYLEIEKLLISSLRASN